MFPPPISRILLAGPPPSLSRQESALGYRLLVIKESLIINDKKHRKYAEKWLDAKYVWLAKYYKRRMDSCVVEDYRWRKVR